MRPAVLAAALAVLGLMVVPLSFAQDTAPAVETPTDAVPAVAPARPIQPEAEEQVVCRSEKPIGSKRAIRVCRTAASKEAAREDTLDALRHRRGTPRGQDLGI